MSRRRTKIELNGGLNITGSDTELLPGQVIQSINFEPALRGGYRRIEGYERDDGRGLSSEVGYCLISCSPSTADIPASAPITVGTVEVINRLQIAIGAISVSTASIADLSAYGEGTILYYQGVQFAVVTSQPEQEITFPDFVPYNNYGDVIAGSADGSTSAIRFQYPNPITETVAIFLRTVDTWSFIAELYQPNIGLDDYFGYSIAISADGTIIAVGAPDLNNSLSQGAVYVFHSASNYSLQQTILGDLFANDGFGEQVRISADGLRIFVSAPSRSFNNDGITENGAVYEYVSTDGAISWQQTQIFVHPVAGGSSRLNRGMDIDDAGQRLIISAISFNSQQTLIVFNRINAVWTLFQEIETSEQSGADSVALIGDATYLACRVVSFPEKVILFRSNGVQYTRTQSFQNDGTLIDFGVGLNLMMSVTSGKPILLFSIEDTNSRGTINWYEYSGGTWTLQQTFQVTYTADSAGFNYLSYGRRTVLMEGGLSFLVALDESEISVGIQGKVAFRTLVSDALKCNYETGEKDALLKDVVAAIWRDTIKPVPGIGPILGVGLFENEVIAFRNRSDSEAVGYRNGTTFNAYYAQQVYPNHNDTSVSYGPSIAVSGNGDWLFSGAERADVLGTSSGQAFLYRRVSGHFLLDTVLTPAVLTTNDSFGRSGAFSQDGKTLAVTARGRDFGGFANAGAVLIFEYENDSWVLKEEVGASDASILSNFGEAIALDASGNFLAVSDTSLTAGGFGNAGAVYLLEKVAGLWVHRQKMIALPPNIGDSAYFGTSLALAEDGKFLLVGAPGEVSNGNPTAGGAYLFTKSPIDNTIWDFTRRFEEPNSTRDRNFGHAVGLSNDGLTVAIGAWDAGPIFELEGSSFIFASLNGLTWSFEAEITAPVFEMDNSFGWSIALSGSGNVLAVGAVFSSLVGNFQGAAYLYSKQGNQWLYESTLTSFTPNDNDRFGSGVALPDNAHFVGVGLINITAAYPHVTLFNIEQGWQPITHFAYLPSKPLGGVSVAIDGLGFRFIGGEPNDDTKGLRAGSVKTFDRIGQVWSEGNTLYLPEETPRAEFGSSVSIEESGNFLLVGSPKAHVKQDSYAEKQQIVAKDAMLAADNVAESVATSFDGRIAIAGAYSGNGGGNDDDQGSIRVFVFDEATLGGPGWEQQQLIIPGDVVTSDAFANTVVISKSGNTFAASSNNTSNNSIYVYERQVPATTWVLEQKILGDASNPLNTLLAMSDDGDMLIAENVGAVYVYVRTAGLWSRIVTLNPTFAGATFGRSAAISADKNTLFIGSAGTGPSGTVFQYLKDPITKIWKYDQKIAPDVGDGAASFGSSLSLSEDGDTLAIGASSYDLSVNGAGAIYIFEKIEGAWTKTALLETPVPVNNENVGRSIVLSADGNVVSTLLGDDFTLDTFVAGALFKKTQGVWAFSQLFNPSDDASDNPVRTLTMSRDASSIFFGYYNPDTGTLYAHSNVNYVQGRVDYFSRGVFGWGYVATLPNSLPEDQSQYGEMLVLSDDGFTALVGAPKHTVNELSKVGSVSVLELEDTWGITTYIEPQNSYADSDFGYAGDLSKDGKVVVIGQRSGFDVNVVETGVVEVHRKTDGTWQFEQLIVSSIGMSGGGFGGAVAVSADGNVIAIGAPTETGINGVIGQGNVHLYEQDNANTWVLTQIVSRPDTTLTPNGNFGSSLDLNETGSLLVVTQTSESIVYTYQRLNNYWSVIDERRATDNDMTTFGEEIKINPTAEYVAISQVNPSLAIGDQGQSFVVGKNGGLLKPNGDYFFDNYNFGSIEQRKNLYGADGVNRGFEYDGSQFRQIYTGADVDTPQHVQAHKQHLLFSLGPSILNSAIGNPFDWTVIQGAAEIGIGDIITGFERVRSGDLAVFGRNETNILSGDSSLNWALKEFSTDTGAIRGTIQPLGDPVFLDDRGIASMPSVDSFSEFSRYTVSELADRIINELRNQSTTSVIVREKNQYRLFFNNGLGVILTFNAEQTITLMLLQYDEIVRKAVSQEDLSGAEVMYFGSDSGYIYRMDSGISFDGAAYDSRFRLIRNDLEFQEYKKRFFKAEFYVQSQGYAFFDWQPNLDYEDNRNPTELITRLDISSQGGFWDAQKLNINKSLRVNTDMKGVARAVSGEISSKSNLISPYIIQTIIFDWSFRRRSN